MNKFLYLTLVAFITLIAFISESESTLPQPKAPNFQYYERPKYRYPYYDEHGRGKLLYGYGDEKELYQYSTYNTLEGIH
ncbi:hypothetical protein PV328_009518 [Microctonus aethiopoides]|uniref:Uncharacterized protein n=1 Tax=Microctonus aethiopoides TaxID=144406 RepID=A0AA39C6S1_9HYME|nr:hypothetical protein PV328_009518 [Microctonus aethiopoides]